MNRIRAGLSVNPYVLDGAIAIGLAALSLLAYVGGASDVGPPGAITITLLLLESLPLVARRRYPVAVAVVVIGATAIHILTVPSGEELRGGLGMLVAFYTIGERMDRRTGLALTVAAGALLGALLVVREPLSEILQSLIQTELTFGVAWLVGDASRIRGLYTRSLEEQARLLERQREERALRAVQEERDRIARELHDAVTHHVSVMVIQAGGAHRALPSRPDDVRTALAAIESTGRQALTDMRRMLGVLGEQESPEPMPGLDGLGSLLEQVRAAGLAVELAIAGEPRPLDPGLELSAYRIIQEGLTNSLKHSGGGRARVTVRYEPGALEISIEDERGTDATIAFEPAHDGRGLLGMRERVAMLRGTFAAHPTATGFQVTALLPIEEVGAT